MENPIKVIVADAGQEFCDRTALLLRDKGSGGMIPRQYNFIYNSLITNIINCCKRF